MALKLFLISLSMICLLGVSQAHFETLVSYPVVSKTETKPNSFVENANILHKASPGQRARFYRNAFMAYDANKDGFVTRDELDNRSSETFPNNLRFASLVNVGMIMALKKFDREGGKLRQIGIDLEDYKRSMKKKLSEVSNALKWIGLNNFYVVNIEIFLPFFTLARSKIDQIAF